MQATHPTHLFLFDLIVPISHKSTYYQAPRYESSSPLLLVVPCQVQLFFSAPVLKLFLEWLCILLYNLITGEILHEIQLCYYMTLQKCIMPHSNKAVSSRKFTQLWSSINVRDQVSHPHKTGGKIIAITQKTVRQKILNWIKSWTNMMLLRWYPKLILTGHVCTTISFSLPLPVTFIYFLLLGYTFAIQ